MLGRWVELLVGSNMETLFGGLLIGLVIVAAIVATLLYSGARPTRGRLAKLCVLTAVLGPLAGSSVGVLSIFFGEVHPLDRWWLLFGVTVVGAIAGGLGAAVIGIIGVVRMDEKGRFSQFDCGSKHKSPPPKNDTQTST